MPGKGSSRLVLAGTGNLLRVGQVVGREGWDYM